MTILRNALILIFSAALLVACGTIPDEEQEQLTSSEIEAAEEAELNATAIDEEAEVSEEVVNLVINLREATNQADLESRIGSALVEGYSDQEMAQALGIATFRSPRKRVLLSVAYVRFRAASSSAPEPLDETYEYWSTPPRERDLEEVAELEEEEEEEQLRRPRRRGLFSWIPGL